MFIIFLAVNFLSVYYFFICLLLFYLFIIFFSALFVWYVNHFLYLYLLIITFLAVYDFYVMVIIFCLLIIILLYVTLLIIILIILLNHLSTLVMAIVSCFIILFIKLWLLLIIITWRTYLIILNKCNPSSQWHLIILNIQFMQFFVTRWPNTSVRSVGICWPKRQNLLIVNTKSESPLATASVRKSGKSSRRGLASSASESCTEQRKATPTSVRTHPTKGSSGNCSCALWQILEEQKIRISEL